MLRLRLVQTWRWRGCFLSLSGAYSSNKIAVVNTMWHSEVAYIFISCNRGLITRNTKQVVYNIPMSGCVYKFVQQYPTIPNENKRGSKLKRNNIWCLESWSHKQRTPDFFLFYHPITLCKWKKWKGIIFFNTCHEVAMVGTAPALIASRNDCVRAASIGPFITMGPSCFGLVRSNINFVRASRSDRNSGRKFSNCQYIHNHQTDYHKFYINVTLFW